MSNFMTLLVEDDPFQRETLADILKDEGFEVIECTTAEAAELIMRRLVQSCRRSSPTTT
jgi:DNA-binding response OmpR family regulator